MKSYIISLILVICVISSVAFAMGEVPPDLDIDYLKENLPVTNTPEGVFRDDIYGSGVEILSYDIGPRICEIGMDKGNINFSVKGEDKATWYLSVSRKTMSGEYQYLISDDYIGFGKDLEYLWRASETTWMKLQTGLYWFTLRANNVSNSDATCIKVPVYIQNEKY
ncbi:MAG: hypothetical protein ABIJ26_02865 [Candidatus Margulisiibacteriota bacterium]|nr:hypothetical protein [Candidatus Margulisiibacteriota bacterium]